MTRKDGSPAFPTTGVPINGEMIFDGMTLRDWFAGMALQGWLTSMGYERSIEVEKIAAAAYLLADAMLKARKE